MLALKTNTTFLIIVNLYFCATLNIDTSTRKIIVKSITGDETLDTNYEESEETWFENMLKDIAYYLRNHKFNEWDRRYFNTKPYQYYTGFYKSFPNPSVAVHWEVHKNCFKDFYNCVTYLHSVIKTAPFTRTDDITTSLNKHMITLNISSLQNQNEDCKKALLYTENTGLPFGGPLEKFNWRSSASYYMCWYTMNENPALSMLGENCDNYANCLDTRYGNRNHDPRSNDKLSFACAMYSFCPDPCCPLKHVESLSECYNNKSNPCYVENISTSVPNTQCYFDRKKNRNLEEIVENKWNVSCHCQDDGFIWNSAFGMCVDINECTTNTHYCNLETEDCLNLPGSYRCTCKWGFTYDEASKKCITNNFVLVDTKDNDQSYSHLREMYRNILGYVNPHY